MTEEELKNWFWNKFYSCYPVKHDNYPDDLFLFYDKLYLRKNILLKLLGEEIEPPKEIDGICLFELDFKSNILWCNYNEIWSILEENYSDNYLEIQYLIKNWTEEHHNINIYLPYISSCYTITSLQYDSFHILKTHKSLVDLSNDIILNDTFKIINVGSIALSDNKLFDVI
jgi:hypothetical protein